MLECKKNSCNEQYCEDQRQPVQTGQAPIHFSGVVGICDLCQQPLKNLRYFADCRLNGGAQWGLVCQDCIAIQKIKFSWGHAQLYARDGGETAPWVLVAGCPDASAIGE